MLKIEVREGEDDKRRVYISDSEIYDGYFWYMGSFVYYEDTDDWLFDGLDCEGTATSADLRLIIEELDKMNAKGK